MSPKVTKYNKYVTIIKAVLFCRFRREKEKPAFDFWRFDSITGASNVNLVLSFMLVHYDATHPEQLYEVPFACKIYYARFTWTRRDAGRGMFIMHAQTTIF